MNSRSPTSGSSTPSQQKVRRARKAINCEPCRASKLKCDRQRPCSGCVLRDTVNSCYPDQPPSLPQPSPSVPMHRTPSSNNREYSISSGSRGGTDDIQNEISQIRRSLAVLDAHFSRRPGTGTSSSSNSSSLGGRDGGVNHHDPNASPTTGDFGFYLGPTCEASVLSSFGNPPSNPEPMHTPAPKQFLPADPSLLSLLPDISTCDHLIQYYFENATFLYKYLHQSSFLHSWNAFKQTQNCDSITLSTIFMVLALSLQYLPWRHPLLRAFPDQPAVVGNRFYTYALHKLDTRLPSLELIEFRLLEIHLLSISKKDCEDVWGVRSEVMSYATAMGLHRDPGKWDMSTEMIERRRWAWWNLVAIERWLAFLFGRPLSISNTHFDTHYPSISRSSSTSPPPSTTSEHASDLSHIAYFKLTFIMGEILDNSFRIRGVPYDRIMNHDRDLVRWLETLPSDLNLDNFQLAKALSSQDVGVRRQGVQSLSLRGTLHHVRLALHRPFTTPQTRDDPLTAESLERAVTAAGDILQLYASATPDFLSNSMLAVPGHVNRGPFHVFAATIFFVFQLIWSPSQPGALLFKSQVQRAVTGFQNIASIGIAEKALGILKCFEGLYKEDDTLIKVAASGDADGVRRAEGPGEEGVYDDGITEIGTSTPSPAILPPPPPHPQPTVPHSLPPPPAPNRSTHPHVPDHPHIPHASLPSTHQFIDASPYPVVSSEEEVLWSASLGNIDSAEWSRFISSSLVGGALVM